MANEKPIRLIVGLGNPGEEYRGTRHNTGFAFVTALAKEKGGTFAASSRYPADIARVSTKGGDLWLMKPMTYMNESGRAVQPFAAYYKLTPEEILVVHDELDVAPGCMKLKMGGGNAGHNGLKSITACLGTPNFWRLRVGIGHPRIYCPAQQVYDWVLGRPSAEHLEGITTCITAALGAVDNLSLGNFDRAQRTITRYGTHKKELQRREDEKATQPAQEPAKA